MNAKENLMQSGICVPEILLPKDTPISKWAVIACDQYTQDREYWQRIKDNTKGFPSTLNLIFPEVYLEDPDKNQRIEKIQNTMNEYLKGVFAPPVKGFIYLERKTGFGRIRKGLVVAIDLETYEWEPLSKALIRATEATILERIPPRMEIRKGAPLELPHIMLLANDSGNILMDCACKCGKSEGEVYSGSLMESSGEITGWKITSEENLSRISQRIEKLKEQGKEPEGSSFLFAVGDGNHSLATAKSVWNEYKREHKDQKNLMEHPARYALVEIVNIYDSGLTFEPIHRILFNADTRKLIDFLAKELDGDTEAVATKTELEQKVAGSKGNFGFVYTPEGKTKYILLKTGLKTLAVSALQPKLDIFIQDNPEIKIDYIHGSDEVFRLGEKDSGTGILLPPIAKDSFFSTISKGGPLPRKSFSMGEASEKRFYLEARKLFKD